MDRRRLLSSSFALAAFGGSAIAEPIAAPLLFPNGPLSTNPLAKRFHALPPAIIAPPTKIMSEHGSKQLGDLRGKVRIVTLWAEWCAPCIAEMRDFADLNRRAGGAGFEVVSILTASQKKLDLGEAKALLMAHDAVLPMWIEPGGGATLLNTVAMGASGNGMLPCTLLIDRKGVIRGRAFGAAPTSSVEMRDGHLTDAAKASMLAGNVHTEWAAPAADIFVAALKSGALV